MSSDISKLMSKMTANFGKIDEDTSYKYFCLVKDENGIAELDIKRAECSSEQDEQCLFGELSKIIDDLEAWKEVCWKI